MGRSRRHKVAFMLSSRRQAEGSLIFSKNSEFASDMICCWYFLVEYFRVRRVEYLSYRMDRGF